MPSDWEYFEPGREDEDTPELPADPKPFPTQFGATPVEEPAEIEQKPKKRVTLPEEPKRAHSQSFDTVSDIAPEDRRGSGRSDSDVSAPDNVDRVIEAWSAPLTPRPRTNTPKTAQAEPDLYADFDPWYKSSLTRFVSMLRREMAAESDEEKFKIFSSCVTKELRLREILYGIEKGPEANQEKTPNSTAESSGPTKAIEPPKGEHVESATPKPTSSDTTAMTEALKALTEAVRAQTPVPQRTETPTPGTSGGPDANNPTVNGANGPIRAYTPFRYSEGPHRQTPKSGRPAYQAYNALRQAGADSGRTLAVPSGSAGPPPPAPLRPGVNSEQEPLESGPEDPLDSLEGPTTGRPQDETFLGLIREKSVAYRRRSLSLDHAQHERNGQKENGLKVFSDLRTLLPNPLPGKAPNPAGEELEAILQRFPDEFDYIHEIEAAWEAATAPQREETKQRRIRQHEESQNDINGAYDFSEIGYADINVLEEEFRQTEAQKQLNEERKEYESYVAAVFTPIESRLRSEIATLRSAHGRALGQLRADHGGVGPYTLSRLMAATIAAHAKLEARHARLVAANVERERRRLEAERVFLAVTNDPAASARARDDFDSMALHARLTAAHDRDNRANALMDAIDAACVRALGENQRLLDDLGARGDQIVKASPELAAAVSEAKETNKPPNWAEIGATMRDVSALVRHLGADSERVLTCFGKADVWLNDADYDVSLCDARIGAAASKNKDGHGGGGGGGYDTDVFRRLRDAKAAEDAKIDNDLRGRLASVRAACDRMMDVMWHARDVVRKLIKQSADAGTDANAISGGGIQSPPDMSPSPERLPSPDLFPRPSSPSQSWRSHRRSPSSSSSPTRPGSVPLSRPESFSFSSTSPDRTHRARRRTMTETSGQHPPALTIRAPTPPATGMNSPSGTGTPTATAAAEADSETRERLRRALDEAKRRNAAKVAAGAAGGAVV